MSFCPKCGKEIGDWVFCNKCGTNINEYLSSEAAKAAETQGLPAGRKNRDISGYPPADPRSGVPSVRS